MTALIVDDEPAVLEMAAQIFEALGYRALTAEGGAQALAVLNTEKIDILFSDVVMPGVNGIELAAKARYLRPEIKIVLTSGYPRSDIVGLPPDIAFLRKPYRWSDIRALLTSS